MNEPALTSCYGGCEQKVPDPEARGWEQLPITGKYRCGACTRELQARSHGYVLGRIEPIGEGRVGLRIGAQEWMHTGIGVDEHGAEVELRNGAVVRSSKPA